MRFEVKLFDTYDPVMLEAIHESSRAVLRKTYKPKPDAKFELVKPLKVEILVVKADNKEVGCLKVHYYKERLHLLGLGVLNNFQGKGVCKAMIEFIKIHAIQNDFKIVSMYTIRETGNVDIFKKFGFEVVDEVITNDFVSQKFDVLHEVLMTMTVE